MHHLNCHVLLLGGPGRTHTPTHPPTHTRLVTTMIQKQKLKEGNTTWLVQRGAWNLVTMTQFPQGPVQRGPRWQAWLGSVGLSIRVKLGRGERAWREASEKITGQAGCLSETRLLRAAGGAGQGDVPSLIPFAVPFRTARYPTGMAWKCRKC